MQRAEIHTVTLNCILNPGTCDNIHIFFSWSFQAQHWSWFSQLLLRFSSLTSALASPIAKNKYKVQCTTLLRLPCGGHLWGNGSFMSPFYHPFKQWIALYTGTNAMKHRMIKISMESHINLKWVNTNLDKQFHLRFHPTFCLCSQCFAM